MSSTSIYKEFCVYITIYKGNKLPPFYIGSTSTKKILKPKPYRGSVRSKEYSKIWEYELKHNVLLFKTIILKSFDTRKEAYDYEEKIQKQFSVVKNPLYINMGYANNVFNMTNKKHSEETKRLMSQNNNHIPISEKTRQFLSEINKNSCTHWDTRINKYTQIRLNSDDYKYLINNNIIIPAGKLRSKSSRNKTSKALKNRIHIYNPITNKRKFIKDTSPIPSGFIRGFCDEQRQYHSKQFTNRLFYYNPETNDQIRLYSDEIVPHGYIRGRINFSDKGNPFEYNVYGIDIRTNTKTYYHKDSYDAKFLVAHNVMKYFKYKNNYTSSPEKMILLLNNDNIIVKKSTLNSMKSYTITKTNKTLYDIIEIIDRNEYVYDSSHNWI